MHPVFSGFVRPWERRSADMDGLTDSEIAGFAVGALLLGASIAAQRVDGFIATSQRRSLSCSLVPLSFVVGCTPIRMNACYFMIAKLIVIIGNELYWHEKRNRVK